MDYNLQLLRDQMGLTQDNLARILGCSKSRIERIERNQSPLTDETVYACLYLIDHPDILTKARS